MPASTFTITTEDGRVLEAFDSGQASWPAVLVHHGTPGSRLLAQAWLEDAKRQSIRLISYSRPGYGGSTNLPHRTVAMAAADVAAIADQLRLERFGVWGYSGGGPHTLATAALLPERVVAAAVVASCAPYGVEGLDWMEGMGQGNVEEFSLALQGEESLRAVLSAQREELLTADPLAMMDSVLSEPDRLVAHSPEFSEFLTASFSEAISQTIEGMVEDDLEFTRPWGFELAEIKVPLQIWQGGQDLMVPPSHGRWLASQLPAADVHLMPAEGHLTLLADRVPELHRWLLQHF